jgi:hypothetical protein
MHAHENRTQAALKDRAKDLVSMHLQNGPAHQGHYPFRIREQAGTWEKKCVIISGESVANRNAVDRFGRQLSTDVTAFLPRTDPQAEEMSLAWQLAGNDVRFKSVQSTAGARLGAFPSRIGFC